MNLKTRIGLRIKLARRQKKFTQAQLAEALDKAVETISNMERGTALTGLETLLRISEVLDVKIGYFFEGAEDRRNVSASRLELEEELMAIARQLRDPEMRLAIALVQAVAEAK